MIRIDLLSVDMLPTWMRHVEWYRSVLVVSLLAGSFAAVHVSHAREEKAIIDDLQRLEQREVQLRVRHDSSIEECRTTDRLAPALARVRSAAAATQAMVRTMRFVAGALPEDVWLDEVAFDGPQLRVAGATGSRDSVTAFFDRLSVGGGLGEVSLRVDDAGRGAAFVVNATR